MTTDPERSIERLRERLEKSDEISDRDAAKLREFSDRLYLLRSEYSDHRHEFHLMRLVKMAEEVGGLADALTDRDAAEALVRWIHQTYENPESNRDRRIALRMFGEHATEGDEKPESIAWIPTGYPNNYDRQPDPTKMYRWADHIEPMIDACRNYRDQGLVTLAWDAGPRSGELQTLTVGNVSDHKYGLRLRIAEGKEGSRTVVLIPSVPYVRQWLNVHPDKDNPDAPLWSKLNASESISANRLRDILKEVVDRADIGPPAEPTPTRLRKSSASYLASKGVSQAHLEEHHGWTRGSDAAARYIAVFGDAADREIAAAHGVDIDDDEEDQIAPLECPRCQRKTPHDEELCVWCGQAMTPTAAEAVEEQDDRVAKSLAVSNTELADDILELRKLLKERPALRTALLQE